MNITIDKDADARLWAFIRAVKVEVGGMGYAFLLEDGTLHWSDTFLIPQEVTSAEVDFEITGGDERAIERAIEDGVLDNPSFVWVSWHSHHTMKAYWSSTDDKRIAAMQGVGVKRMLSLVGAHDGTYKMRLDVFPQEPLHGVVIPQITMDDLTFKREVVGPSEFEKLIAAEVEANVVEKRSVGLYQFGNVGPTLGSLAGSAHEVREAVNSSKRDAEWEKLLEQHDDDEYGKDAVLERRIVAELVEEGYTKSEAEDLLLDIGVEDCEDLLWSRWASRGPGA